MFWYELLTQLVMPSASLVGLLVLAAGLRRLRGWREAAERCGLSEARASWRPSPNLTARSGPTEIRLTGGPRSVYVVATAVRGLPLDLAEVAIRSEEPREIETGDEAFDSAFRVKGPLKVVAALLDVPTRHMLLEAAREGSLSFAGGQLRTEVREDQLLRVLPLFRELGRRFAEPMDVPRRLAENVRRDPEPGVRLHNLFALIRDYPGHPTTEGVLRTACEDASPAVRLHAALELGDEGRGVLLALAEGLEDDAVSARAVRGLGRTLPLELLQSTLRRAWPRHFTYTTFACVEVLSSHGGAAVETLAEVMARDSFTLAVAAAHALGATDDPAAEPPLLTALMRDSPELRMAAAMALGRVGTANAVLPLQEVVGRFGQLRGVTRQSIAAIQERLAGASPGQLSLAAADAGQLSLAPHEAGQLSFPPDDPAGRLSVPPEKAPTQQPGAKISAYGPTRGH